MKTREYVSIGIWDFVKNPQREKDVAVLDEKGEETDIDCDPFKLHIIYPINSMKKMP